MYRPRIDCQGGLVHPRKKFGEKRFGKKKKKNLKKKKFGDPPEKFETPKKIGDPLKNWRPPKKLEIPPKIGDPPPKNWRPPKIGDARKIGDHPEKLETPWDQTTAPLLTESQSRVKILPWPNFVVAGKNSTSVTIEPWTLVIRI